MTVDEYDKARGPPATPGLGHPGPAPSVTRSAVVSLALAAQWARLESARAVYRDATQHLRAACPGLLARSQFNRLVPQTQDLLVVVGVGQGLTNPLGGRG